MALTDRLPFSDRPDVRDRIDELFSREILGAVLVGKFVGDYAAFLTTGALGPHLGFPLGIGVTVGCFVYWDRIERRARQEKDKLNPAQTRVSDDWGGVE